MPWPWLSVSKQIWIRSFKWGTVHFCKSRVCKNIWGQSWRLQRKLPTRPTSNPMLPGPAGPTDFLLTSNFDLWYFCSLLTYKNVQYLIWKIWFISVWSLKPKAVVWLLIGFMLGQSTLISYHTEANGYIFFAAGVCLSVWRLPLIASETQYIITKILLDVVQVWQKCIQGHPLIERVLWVLKAGLWGHTWIHRIKKFS